MIYICKLLFVEVPTKKKVKLKRQLKKAGAKGTDDVDFDLLFGTDKKSDQKAVSKLPNICYI